MGNYRGDRLAVLYNDRGVEYANKGDRDRSIADLDKSIRVKSARVTKALGGS